MAVSKKHYFLPGEELTIDPAWRRSASIDYHAAKVWAPGRLHMGVFDFSKMAPGLGGGGIGISTDTASSEVTVRRGETAHTQAPTTRHLLKLFTECIGYQDDDLIIETHQRITHTHCGFGSNVTLNSATLAALNSFFGSPFSVDELWRMLTQNYVESADDGVHIYIGLDTGVGEACLLYGGLVWIDAGRGVGDGRYAGNLIGDDLWVVTAVGRMEALAGEKMLAFGEATAQGLGDQSEVDVVAGICQAYQQQWGDALQRFFRDRMRPALLRNDLAGLLALGWELNEIGNMRVLAELYRPDRLTALTEAMRTAGSLWAGMSSAGPGFFAFADSRVNAESLSAILTDQFGNLLTDCTVGRAGRKLSIDVELKKEVSDGSVT